MWRAIQGGLDRDAASELHTRLLGSCRKVRKPRILVLFLSMGGEGGLVLRAVVTGWRLEYIDLVHSF